MSLDDLNIKSLRASIGVVSQEPTLFEGSVEENIRLGNESATKAQVVSAAKQVNAHQFIHSVAAGVFLFLSSYLFHYRAIKCTLVKEALRCRAVKSNALPLQERWYGNVFEVGNCSLQVRNPRLLLLDEATSALNAHSEQLVQQILERVCFIMKSPLNCDLKGS